MRKALEDSQKQANKAAAFKVLSEQRLAEAQTKHKNPPKKTEQTTHSINTVQADLEKAKTAIAANLNKKIKNEHEDPEKLRESLLGARQSTQDAFRKSTTPSPKAPWYAVFCCCVQPVDDGKQPLVKAAR